MKSRGKKEEGGLFGHIRRQVALCARGGRQERATLGVVGFCEYSYLSPSIKISSYPWWWYSVRAWGVWSAWPN